MKKIFLILTGFCLFCTFAAAQENQIQTDDLQTAKVQKDFNNHIIPSIGFQAIQTGTSDFILSPSVSLQFMQIKDKTSQSSRPDLLAAGLSYSQDYYTDGIGPDKINRLHGASIFGNLSKGKNTFTLMLASNGEVPFSSLKSIAGIVVYVNQLVKTDNFSFSLGAGLVAADFGINIKGQDIYIFPLPLFSLSYNNSVASASLSLMGPPTLLLQLFPKSMIRFKGNCGIVGIKSIRDLTFDCALVYYPLYNSPLAEFLSISAGVMNKSSSSVLRDKTRYGIQYYSAYGEINASFVTIRCGYNFNGKKFVEKAAVADLPKGIFASIQGVYMF